MSECASFVVVDNVAEIAIYNEVISQRLSDWLRKNEVMFSIYKINSGKLLGDQFFIKIPIDVESQIRNMVLDYLTYL